MSIKTSISDRSPQIFLAMGIAGFIGSTVLAVAKADKVKPIFEKAKKEFKQPPTPGSKSNTKIIMEASIDIFKEMALPIGLTIMSTGFVLKSYNVLNNRHLAAVGTIDILNTSLNAHKKAVKEELGEEAVKKIEDGLNRKHITDQMEALHRKGSVKATDQETFTRYFSKETSNKFPKEGADTVLPFLKSAETYFNQLLHSRERFGRPGVVRFNEVLDYIGLPKVPEGETSGWVSYHGEGFVDFGISGAYYADYDGILDRYNCVADTNKIPRSDSGYILNFNVNPYIIR